MGEKVKLPREKRMVLKLTLVSIMHVESQRVITSCSTHGIKSLRLIGFHLQLVLVFQW